MSDVIDIARAIVVGLVALMVLTNLTVLLIGMLWHKPWRNTAEEENDG